MPIITVNNLGKAYKVYATRFARLKEWITPFAKARHTLRWILQDINFTVNSGESVAILGVNGAGKSTLLKILVGTTQPTMGNVKVVGRVAALLELGIGFHPNFTGRQNAQMAAQLLGHDKDEITQFMPEVEAFADIGDYIDQPVRVYSSGMQMRLAFSVATAIRPDILIVDEAFAVGDAAFQRKCFRRIEEYLAKGTALLLVSHDIDGIKRLCKRGLLISQGRLVMTGDAKSVCDHYEKILLGSKTPSDSVECTVPGSPLLASCELAYGDGRAFIDSISLGDGSRRASNIVVGNEPLFICYRIRIEQMLDNPVISLMIKTREGIAIFGTDSDHLGIVTGQLEPNQTLNVKFELKNNLAPGEYFLNCGLRDTLCIEEAYIHRRIDALVFNVIAGENTTAKVGVAELSATLEIK
ncbi:MAG: ABC transporter ATP-binding protein [Gallionella sp.]